MKPGEIYFGKNNRKGKHPMVFLSDIDEYTFNGLMLTHSPLKNNMRLESKDFEWTSDNFSIDETHVVRRSLIKRNDWKPFTLVGELSTLGLKKVRGLIRNQTPEYF